MLRKRFVTYRELKNGLRLAIGKQKITKTVNRGLKGLNLVACKPATSTSFTAVYKPNRLNFCRDKEQ